MVIRLFIVVPVFLLLGYVIIIFRLGGNVPIDFVDRDKVITEHSVSDWRFYNHREWAAYAHELSEKRDYQRAEQAAKEAVGQNPANTIAILALFSTYYYTGQLDKARYYYDKHAELYPAQHKVMFKADKK